MELWVIGLTSFGVALSGAVMPGSLLASNIVHTLQRGIAGGEQVVAGHALLELVLVAALLAGLQQVLNIWWVPGMIALAGSLVLIYLALATWRGAAEELPPPGIGTVGTEGEAPEQRRAPAASAPMAPLASGMLATLANPYWLIWWATIGAGYLSLAYTAGQGGIIIFYLGHIGGDFAWYTLVSAGLVAGRRYFHGALYYRLLQGCSIFLLVLAAYFLYDGLNSLLPG